jgi:glycosyltransferase involved in cell wall biosynthesis
LAGTLRIAGSGYSPAQVSATSFTFILPALNASGALFETALASIRRQRYPQERVEIVVADGGSTDDTRAVADHYGARVIDNPNRLAEWGVKEGILVATGDISVVFAADNELVGDDWLSRVEQRFRADPSLSATFGRLVSGPDDPRLNRYVELIQSEPLNWFLNRNLEDYLGAADPPVDGFISFDIDPGRPLVWGANGLAVRTELARPIWEREGYVADVDAFYAMVVSGHTRVAYLAAPYCYHHQVVSFSDLRRKWLRNSKEHLVRQADTRELDWVTGPGFRRRALLWGVYSFVPVFSTADALRRGARDRSPYWLYHPPATFLQAFTYAQALLGSAEGRALLRRSLRRNR